MKKLTIALATGLMSMSGWSACTYNFFANLLKSGKTYSYQRSSKTQSDCATN